MKALQKNKQAIQNNGTRKSPRNVKGLNAKKSEDNDKEDYMVFSEYEVWPILSELYKHIN